LELKVLLLEGSNGGHAGPMRSAGLQLLSLQFAHAHLFVLRLCRLVRKRACAEASWPNGTHEDDGAQTVHGDGAFAEILFVLASAPF
jgi:hypothetical protein